MIESLVEFLVLLGVLTSVGFLLSMSLRAMTFVACAVFAIFFHIILGWLVIFLFHVFSGPHFQTLLFQSGEYFDSFILWQK